MLETSEAWRDWVVVRLGWVSDRLWTVPSTEGTGSGSAFWAIATDFGAAGCADREGGGAARAGGGWDAEEFGDLDISAPRAPSGLAAPNQDFEGPVAGLAAILIDWHRHPRGVCVVSSSALG